MARHWQSRSNPFTPIRRMFHEVLRMVDVDRQLFPDYSHIYDDIEWKINDLLTGTDI